ncbi:hypothetical protein BDN72DRAFT_835395 [Pluteus cervinus]|uniref:Uncharacterized protein n=1 Tax=Pluteus cervinus TaxID=181527 RepID=A0ACD3B5W0_9AGAR|nr:hypothetical protein BDN72DRAFT_835395 [Pluteus cervinus]
MSAATSSPYPAAGLSLDNTLGAAFVGVIFASILFGVTNLQVFIYFHQYPKDSRFQKASVATLWVLDAAHLALIVHGVYHYAVAGFGDFSGLDNAVWSLKVQSPVTVLTIVMVQCLYVHRIWILGQDAHRWLSYLAAFIVVCGSSVGVALAYESMILQRFSQLESMGWAIIAGFAIATFIDFIISAIVCFYLQRGRSGFSETDSKIVILMRYIAASGLATSLCSMGGLIAFVLSPRTFLFFGLEFLVEKLYVNSFLAMLNARNSIRNTRLSISDIIDIEAALASRRITIPSDVLQAALKDLNKNVQGDIISTSPINANTRPSFPQIPSRSTAKHLSLPVMSSNVPFSSSPTCSRL